LKSPVQDAWKLLYAEDRAEPGWHGRRIHVTAATPIYAALQIPGPTKGLLLQVKAKSILPGNTFPSSAGFEVQLDPVDAGPNGSVRICLRLTERRYEDVFVVLAEDVAAAVAGAGSEPAGLAAMLGRLNTWQRFLKRPGQGILSDQEQVGLFAELTVLSGLLADGLAASDAVRSWRGPWGAPQDFTLATCSLEVEATVSANPVSFEVSNLAQLDERVLPSLILCHLTLARAMTGMTLPELVDTVGITIAATDPGALLPFNDSLLEVGYLEAHRPEYESERYKVHSERHFLVKAGFPRILADELRTGVTACSYSVQISACMRFLVDAPTARRIVHGA
jgi:hypothetical protein